MNETGFNPKMISEIIAAANATAVSRFAETEGETALLGLNPSQTEAVGSTEGYVRVIAGAGSGKTHVLSRRFAYLVNDLGVMPNNIMCVTFTNKAAREMRQRIHKLTGDNDTAFVGTFHSMCVSILQEDSNAVSYPKSFMVLDNSDIDAMLGIIYEERGLSLRNMTFSKARDMIEVRKLFADPLYYRYMIDMSLDQIQQRYLEATAADDIIFYGYLYQEKKCFGLDYNDLIKFTLHIFQTSDEIRLKWQKRLEYIMIDEFQDIDSLQIELMEALCGYHGNLFVVGDPDQTIYTWRGANVRYLLDFDKRYPNVKTVVMNDNYRSTPQILNAANSLISRNETRMKKDLIPMRHDGPVVECHCAPDCAKEGEWIAQRIDELLQQGASYGDIAVLYRAHYVSRSIEEAFVREQIPYAIHSGAQFFDRMEVKDALSYLRMIAFADDLAFARIANKPKRNLGEKRMRFLREKAEQENCTLYQALKRNLEDPIMRGTKAAEFVELIDSYAGQSAQLPVSELLSTLLDESGYELALRTEGSQERLDNLAELKQAVYEYETSCGEEASLENFLLHVGLFTNQDTATAKDKVTLMTVHAAKGLEFPHVFLCGMNEGIFPSRKVKTLAGMEEERRLAFVALTRAQDSLHLSGADGYNLDGVPRYPSRFVLDIDPKHIQFTPEPPEESINQARAFIKAHARTLTPSSSVPKFSKGSVVVHRTFGRGTVVDIDADRGAYIIQFDKLETTRSIAFKIRLEAGE